MKTMTRQELAEAYGIDRKTLSKRLRQADIHPRPYEPLSPAHVWAFLDHYGVPEGWAEQFPHLSPFFPNLPHFRKKT